MPFADSGNLKSTSLVPVFFKNGRLIDPKNGIDGLRDLLVVDGVVAEVVEPDGVVDLPGDTQSIDLSGKWLLPGLIDMHVHLREPGEEYKETILSGARAAAAGGFTAVACMPNTRPVNDSRAVTTLILSLAAGAPVRVYPVGCISLGAEGRELAPFGEMRRAGIVAVSDDGLPVGDGQLFKRALEYAKNYDLLVISHSEDGALSRGGSMNDGACALRLGLQGIPTVAESVMVYRDLALAEYTGSPVHIAHVSAGESVDLIRRAKARGCPVTAETAPHYFTLTDEAVGNYNTNAKMNPPLRSEEDRLAVIEGLADGTIDVIATDHAPHSRLEKEKEFDQAANGIIGLETSLPLALKLVRDGTITPVRMVELMSANPARILGIPGGGLGKGQPADLVVVDPQEPFVYSKGAVLSRSRNSPFLDWELTGRALMTMMGGGITCKRPGGLSP